MFDGGECSPAVSDCPEADQCMDVGEDGVCETRCNTPQCPYDGKDCTAQVEEFVSVTPQMCDDCVIMCVSYRLLGGSS